MDNRGNTSSRCACSFAYPAVQVLLLFAITLSALVSGCAQILGNAEELPSIPKPLDIDMLAPTADAVVGQQYTIRLTAKGGGTRDYLWEISGSLPDWAQLSTPSANIAELRGTPDLPGVHSFTVRLNGRNGVSVDQPISIRVKPDIPFAQALANATEGLFYTATLSAAGSEHAYTWSTSGTLPAGMSLSGTGKDATLSGIPQESGTFHFTVRATDSANVALFADKTVQLIVEASTVLGLTPDAILPPARIGQYYWTEVVPIGGVVKDYSWLGSAWNVWATSLPKGLELRGTGLDVPHPTGGDGLVVCGVPENVGYFSNCFGVFLWDDASTAYAGSALKIAVFSLEILDAASFQLETDTTLPVATEGMSYTGGTLSTTGGDTSQSFTWSIREGQLPDGLSLVGSGATAQIQGTAQAPLSTTGEPYTFVVEVTNGSAACAKRFSIRLALAGQDLEIADIPTQVTREGWHYSLRLEVLGGTPPYTWELQGSPDWLTITGAAVDGTLTSTDSWCEISGTVAAPASVGVEPEELELTVNVTDAAAAPLTPATDTRDFSIFVDAEARITTDTLPPAVAGTAYSQAVTAAGVYAVYEWRLGPGKPAWLNINSDGVLTGTPTGIDVGSSTTFDVILNDSRTAPTYTQSTAWAVKSLTLAVSAPAAGSLQITSDTVSGTAYEGELFGGLIEAAGGTPPYTWSILASGDPLPSGMLLNAARGVIYGKVPAGSAGTHDLSVQVKDATQTSFVDTVSFTILAAPDAGTIITLAGGGTIGYGGDTLPASFASFGGWGGLYSGIAADRNGNLYVADQGNFRVRKIDANTGIISTIAGNGQNEGQPTNNVLATSSVVNPVDIAVDYNSNVYILDFDPNNSVRRIDAVTGKISTISPTVDTYGLLTNASSSIEIGRDSATGKEWLYVASYGSGSARVYRYELKATAPYAEARTIFAGSGGLVHSGDGGPAIYAGIMSESCMGIAADNSGNVYITAVNLGVDPIEPMLRKIDSAGIITTILRKTAPSGAFILDFDHNSKLTCDPQGNIYAAPYDNLAEPFIFRYDVATNALKPDVTTRETTTAAGWPAHLGWRRPLSGNGDGAPAIRAKLHPSDTTFDAAGNLYILEDNAIRKVIRVNQSKPLVGVKTTAAHTIEPLNETSSTINRHVEAYAECAVPRTQALDVQVSIQAYSATVDLDYAGLDKFLTIAAATGAIGKGAIISGLKIKGDSLRERGEHISLQTSVPTGALLDPLMNNPEANYPNYHAIIDQDGGVFVEGVDLDDDNQREIGFTAVGSNGSVYMVNTENLPAEIVVNAQAPGGGYVMNGDAATGLTLGNIQHIGDCNGDGKGDVAVMLFASTSQRTLGIIFGSASHAPGTLTDADFDARIVFTSSSAAFTANGARAVEIGDFNGDGIDDIGVLEDDYAPNGMGRGANGRLLVYFGSASLASSHDGEDADIVMISPQPADEYLDSQNSRLGAVVQGKVDLNADGYSDLMIYDQWHGAPPASSAWRHYLIGVFCVYGGPRVRASYTLGHPNQRSSGDQDFFISVGSYLVLPPDYDFYTFGVGVGDINGDHYDDIVLGTPKNPLDISADSQVQVYLGPLSAKFTSYSQYPTLFECDLKLSQGKKDFGRHIAVGDFDGDGKDDIAISEPGGPDAGTKSGFIHLFSGATLTAIKDNPDVQKPFGWQNAYFDCTYSSASVAKYRSITSLGFIGDTDGDGKDELSVGFADADTTVSGQTVAGGGAVVILKGEALPSWSGPPQATPTRKTLYPAHTFIGESADFGLGAGLIRMR